MLTALNNGLYHATDPERKVARCMNDGTEAPSLCTFATLVENG
jgi:hypothetical protein